MTKDKASRVGGGRGGGRGGGTRVGGWEVGRWGGGGGVALHWEGGREVKWEGVFGSCIRSLVDTNMLGSFIKMPAGLKWKIITS